MIRIISANGIDRGDLLATAILILFLVAAIEAPGILVAVMH